MKRIKLQPWLTISVWLIPMLFSCYCPQSGRNYMAIKIHASIKNGHAHNKPYLNGEPEQD